VRCRDFFLFPLLALCLAPSLARAAQECTVDAQALNFGVYDSTSPAPLDGVGEIRMTCSGGTSYRISMKSAKVNPDGSREMKTPASPRALYFLYLDPSRSIPWGDGTGGTRLYAGTGTGLPQSVPVFGRVPARQRLAAGTYSDDVLITVSW
jgi:spore coat protein U-like protein